MSGKSGSVTPRLTPTLTPASNLGVIAGFFRLAIAMVAPGAREGGLVVSFLQRNNGVQWHAGRGPILGGLRAAAPPQYRPDEPGSRGPTTATTEDRREAPSEDPTRTQRTPPARVPP